MASDPQQSAFSSAPQNIGISERWMSSIAGLALTLLAARRGGALGRLVAGTAGLSLLARGATGFCAVKSSLAGETTLKEGLQEQWHRVKAGISSPAASLDSLDAMYMAELQELLSAERQFGALLVRLSKTIVHSPLAIRLGEYANELQARAVELEQLLVQCGADPGRHPDEAMEALINETCKMAQVTAENLRDTALTASIQRLIHYKIAGYGTVAAYAKSLGRIEEAGRFAELADRDKTVDAQLSDFAKSTLNPQAAIEPAQAQSPPAPVRPH